MAQEFPGFSEADMELLQLQDSFEESQRLQRQGRREQQSSRAGFTTNRKYREPLQGWKACGIKDIAQRSDVEREGTGGSDGQLEEGKEPCGEGVEPSVLSQKANVGPDSQSDTLKYPLEEYFIIIIN